MRSAKYDLTGETFGHLTALEQVEPPKGEPPSRTYWLCRCEKCKGTEILTSSDLTGRRRAQCRECTMQVHNLVGHTFGIWKVVRRAEEAEIPNQKSAEHQSWWRVKCVLCGREGIRSRANLRKLHKQCECIEVQQRPRPFVGRIGEENKPTRPLSVKKKECAWCGKVFELECIGQWGWNIGHDLFCTYKCMRKAEEARKGKNKRGARFA